MIRHPRVAVVILNWNGKQYLGQFLPSLLQSTYPALKVVVADNGSTDGSPEWLRTHHPTVELLQLGRNWGFARGYNEALARVKADYYLLLNSDVEVTPGWIEPLVATLEEGPRRAACQPRIRAQRSPELFEYAGGAGGWLDAFGYPFARGRVFDICEKDTGQYAGTEEVFWASGAALLIRAEAWKASGGFDPFFFAHQEEIDLCWRLQLGGWSVWCCPDSTVFHVGGGTLPRGNSKKTFLNFRNNAVMLAKNLPLRESVWKLPFRIGLDQISALKGILSGDSGYFWAIMRAHLSFYGWLLAGPRQKRPKGRRLRTLKGVYPGLIVWQHFAKGKTRFDEVVRRP